MSDEFKTNLKFELSNAHAFGNYNKISTSFADGLEKSIIELAYTEQKLLMSDILERFGNYPKVHQQVKRLVLENKLVLRELEDNSLNENNYRKQQIELARPELSKWVDLAAQPCLTCPIYNECGLDNPVSPATCVEFNDWLDAEIDLEILQETEF
jgi:hypothetical protein